MKNIKKRAETGNGAVSSRKGTGGLSTLGEALQEKDPDFLKKIGAYQESDVFLSPLMDVLDDWLPYGWKDPERFETAVESMAQGQYEKAVEIFQQVLNDNPDGYPAYHLMGFAWGRLNDRKLEIENYRKALKLKPDYPQLYLNLGAAYWSQGKEKRAFEAFKKAVTLSPEFAVTDHWLTFLFVRLVPEGESAEPGSGNSGGTDRIFAETAYLMGNAYIEFGLHIPARHAFKGAVRAWPDFAEAYYGLGEMHIKKLRNPKRAEKYLQKAEELFVRQGELQRATLAHQLQHSKEAVAEHSKAAEDWLKEGLRLQRMGRYQGAIDAYKMAVSFQENFVDVYYNLGIAYGSLEETGMQLIHKAVWAFKHAIRLKPDFIHAYIALAAAYVKQGKFQDAIDLMENGQGVALEDPNLFYYLGVAYRMLENIPRALDVLRKAARMNPDSVSVQFYLGLTLMDGAQYQEAGEAFTQALRIKPDFADGHYMAGVLYYEKLPDLERALSHLKKAEKLYAKLENHSQAAQVRRLLTNQPV